MIKLEKKFFQSRYVIITTPEVVREGSGHQKKFFQK
jgi:hypothetical protein